MVSGLDSNTNDDGDMIDGDDNNHNNNDDNNNNRKLNYLLFVRQLPVTSDQ